MVEFNKDWLKMSNRRIINSIHLVTGCGIGDEYKVGKKGVTNIIAEEIYTKPNEPMCVFVIYRGYDVVAKISSNTPFVLEYENETE